MMTAISVLLGFVIVIAGGLFESWVIWLLWEWHLVPLGLPQASFGAAVAVNFIVSILTSHAAPYPSDDKKAQMKRMLSGILLPVVALLIGWALR